MKHAHGKSLAFTLIELLIVVAIVAILAAIAVANLQQARTRALMSANMARMRAIGAGLQTYLVDWDTLPLGDREAGPFPSFGPPYYAVGNGPAGGGSWDGAPWVLVEMQYVTSEAHLFNARYLNRFAEGKTLRGDWPRYHNFRYAYNSSAATSGGHLGGDGDIMSGETWLLRDLHIGPDGNFPGQPDDFSFPWGLNEDLEHVMMADFTVRLVVGGTLDPPDPKENPVF
jgi:prepilin-type N-terminal cleavage/methylation domain-containing protein